MPAVPQPQQMQVAPPKQITYPNVVIEAQALPEGNRVLIIQAPGEVLLFPMSGEYAEALGKKLTAPHIIPAGQNGHPPPPS